MNILVLDRDGGVYIASPIATYRQIHRYPRYVQRVRASYPDRTIIEPRGRWLTTAQWLTEWHALLPTLAAVAFFCDRDGTIGAGVFQEIADARRAGLPIFGLTNDVVPQLRTRFALRSFDGADARRFARVAFLPDGSD